MIFPARYPRQTGFTLLALLFFVAGLGVGMAALGTLWHTAQQREKERELLFVGDQYRRAIDSFWSIPLPAGQTRRLPKSLDELLLDPRFIHTVRHLRRLYPDPMTGKPEWGMVKDAQGGIAGVHSLAEGKPFKRALFSDPYADFENKSSYRDWVFAYEGGAPAAASAPTKEAAEGKMPGAGATTGTTPPVDLFTESGDGANLAQRRQDCARGFSAAVAACKPLAGDAPAYRTCRNEAGAAYTACMAGG